MSPPASRAALAALAQIIAERERQFERADDLRQRGVISGFQRDRRIEAAHRAAAQKVRALRRSAR